MRFDPMTQVSPAGRVGATSRRGAGARGRAEAERAEQQTVGDDTVARTNDMPQIGVRIVPSRNPQAGIGGPGLPAPANAVFRLTGQRLRRPPFDPASA